MRRELQQFHAQLTAVAESGSPEFRQRLLSQGVAQIRAGKLVLNAPLGDELKASSEPETFEQMRVRITRRIQLPMWPGGVCGVLGFALLICSITAPNDTKRV